ncbi:MAG TPA: histidine--tRNA ligase [Flavobacterium lutivivi]|nr:histidine--tRNA ligase [Flavobacterium lutivivi]
MAQKPSIPKGTRDFSPVEVSKRNYIISIMRKHFENYGYQPIETPSFENSETLMGKYGEEGDRLIFKILNSGEYMSNFSQGYIAGIHNLVENFYLAVINKNIGSIKNFIRDNNWFISFLDDFLDEKTNQELFNLKKIFDRKFIVQILEEVKENGDLIFKNLLRRKEDLKYASLLSNEQPKIVKDDLSDEEIKLIYLFSCFIYTNWLINSNSNKVSAQISEKALRYDLTVPFARYVVQHQNEIEFPFKRYQIQPVWRADRPQKGRFREFYQCDADVVGSTSLWQEVELVQLYDSVFAELGLNGVTIKINNRKILSGIAEVIGASDKLIDFTVALDKLDKIGEEGVKKEMLEKGISENALDKVQPLFNFTGTIEEKIEKLSVLLSNSEEGKKGIEELKFICDNVSKLGLKKAVLDLDVTLARGLNYYTGAIFEVAAPKEVAMGSIGGGGRYDDLTGIFDAKNKMSGVGISFGLDRIYLVLDELNLFPETVIGSTKVLFLNFGESQTFEAMKAISELRNQNIKAELYPDAAKIDKQFKHAERRGIPYVVKEISNDLFTLKNLKTGEQKQTGWNDLISELK